MFRQCIKSTKSFLWSTQYVLKWTIGGVCAGAATGAASGAFFGIIGGALSSWGNARTNECDQVLNYAASLGCSYGRDSSMEDPHTRCGNGFSCPGGDADVQKILHYQVSDTDTTSNQSDFGHVIEQAVLICTGIGACIGGITGISYAYQHHALDKAKAFGEVEEKKTNEIKEEVKIISVQSVAQHPSSLFAKSSKDEKDVAIKITEPPKEESKISSLTVAPK